MILFSIFFRLQVVLIIFSFKVWAEITPRNSTSTKIFLVGESAFMGTVFHNETEQYVTKYEKGPCGKLMWIVEEFPGSFSGVCQCIQTPLGIRNLAYWQPSNRCYFEYQQGPCKKAEWLNYNSTSQQVECQNNPCISSQSEIPTDEITLESLIELETNFTFIDNDINNNDTTCLHTDINLRSSYFQRGKYEISRFLYHNESQKFYPSGERGPCPILMVMTWSPFGYGECRCAATTNSNMVGRPILYWKNTNRCYFSFHQGPCVNGEWFVPTANGEAECKKNPCLIVSPLVNNDTDEFLKPDKKFFVPNLNGSCYETSTTAFCKNGQKLFLTSTGVVPECANVNEDGSPVVIGSAVGVANTQSCAPGYTWDESNSCVKPAIIE